MLRYALTLETRSQARCALRGGLVVVLAFPVSRPCARGFYTLRVAISTSISVTGNARSEVVNPISELKPYIVRFIVFLMCRPTASAQLDNLNTLLKIKPSRSVASTLRVAIGNSISPPS
jgi:hypothetical protein